MKNINIRLENIEKTYSRKILDKIVFNVNNGDYKAIIGKSGAGKTTLMNILGLIEDYDSGNYFFNGKILKKKDYSRLRLSNIGFIYQSYNLLPTMTCRENILLPCIYSKEKAQNLKRIVDMLEISSLLEQKISYLSGGEKQRIAIARALILDPPLIIADEPTGNLDSFNKDKVFELFESENNKGRAIVLITHDVEAAAKAKNIIRLENGKLYEEI